jgi:acetyl-CoA acetyltransferase
MLDIRKRDIVILSGVRTAFGKFGGSLKDISATDLASRPRRQRSSGPGSRPTTSTTSSSATSSRRAPTRSTSRGTSG